LRFTPWDLGGYIKGVAKVHARVLSSLPGTGSTPLAPYPLVISSGAPDRDVTVVLPAGMAEEFRIPARAHKHWAELQPLSDTCQSLLSGSEP
jgi:hypothetical protein